MSDPFASLPEPELVDIRHEDVATQKHYDHADLSNLREAVKGIDFTK